MKTIVVFGAGKSATVLISYLNRTCRNHSWKLVVADASLQAAQSKITDESVAEAVAINILESEERRLLIEAAAVVISLLPPHLHIHVARDCVSIGRHLLTASYVDDAMKELRSAIQSKELLFLCEMGLDPGIDHMSAMQLIDGIKDRGGNITSFKSHCGGLVAPESDNNPWHYKISWNPRNIVRAGSSGAIYKQQGIQIEKPYTSIFENCEELRLPPLPALAWYPNRDSLSYIPLYQLKEADTFIRTTLRYAPFCKGWDVLVDLNLTAEDDQQLVVGCRTFHEWFSKKLAAVEQRPMSLRMYLELYVPEINHEMILEQIGFLELEAAEPLPAGAINSADLLQFRLEQQLALQPDDKDLVVMLHEIDYKLDGSTHALKSSLVVKGEDALHTAMAKTVGLPLGIAAKLLLEGKLSCRGLRIPTTRDIYEPVLKELAAEGIAFQESND